MSVDPSFSTFLLDLDHGITGQLVVAGIGVAAGAALVHLSDTSTLGRLALYFGAQAFAMSLAGWLLCTRVTVEKGTLIAPEDGVAGGPLGSDVRGFPARLGVAALQQLVSLALGLTVQAFRCLGGEPGYQGTPRLPRTGMEMAIVCLLGSAYALSTFLNSLNLGDIKIATSIIVHSYLPLSTEILQRMVSSLNLYPQRSAQMTQTALMVVSVVSTGIFTTAKLMAAGEWERSSSLVLNCVSCLASLFCESLTLVLAGVMGELKFAPTETVVCMAVPATLLLLPVVIFLPRTLSEDWALALGREEVTDLELLMITSRAGGETLSWLALSGLFGFAFNTIQFLLVQGLSPAYVAFAANFNKGSLLLLVLLLPLLGADALPPAPYIYCIWASVVVNTAAFWIYTYLQAQPLKNTRSRGVLVLSTGAETQTEAAPLLMLASDDGAAVELTESARTATTIRSTDFQGDAEVTDWARLGGQALEEPILKGWVRLLRISYLKELLRTGGVLQRRQDMPDEAYESLASLQQTRAGKARLKRSAGLAVTFEWLPIVVVSHPWLQPSHPDPHAETLRSVMVACECLPDDHAVLIDFTALHQAPRSEEEDAIFERARLSLGTFFSHEHTLVLQITQLPEDYPKGKHWYDLPEGANVASYNDRGWCFCEALISGLSKDSALVWDLAKLPAEPSLARCIVHCWTPRPAPLEPATFSTQLVNKTFTEPTRDPGNVQKVYEAAFKERITDGLSLTFTDQGWDVPAATQLMKALRGSSVQQLNIAHNELGDEGTVLVAEALSSEGVLQQLNLSANQVGTDGVKALANALDKKSALQRLTLHDNKAGDEGATDLAEALGGNPVLQHLDLRQNGVGAKGGMAIAQALNTNSNLRVLHLEDNNLGDEGVQALAEALRSNNTLEQLGLHSNAMGAAGACCLGEVLSINSALLDLDLSWNLMGDEGVEAVAASLRSNNSLQLLDLHGNGVTPQGALVLAESLHNNAALQGLDVSWNRVGPEGARAFAELLSSNSTLRRLNLAANHVGSEGAVVLGEALRENSSLQHLDLTMNIVRGAGVQVLTEVQARGVCRVRC